MKKFYLAIIATLALGLVACSSNPTANLGVNAQRVAVSQFDRDGVRLFYTLDGKLTAVESVVYVPIWGSDSKATDDAQKRTEKIAKIQLKNFADKKMISGSLSTSIIAINLEHASEQKNNPAVDSQNLVASDREVFLDKNGKDLNAKSESSKVLDDANKLAQLLDKSANWSDIASGMVLLSAKPVNSGQTLEAIYRWSASPAGR